MELSKFKFSLSNFTKKITKLTHLKETGPLFNSISLKIYDSKVAQEFKNNQVHEFNQMFWIFNFFATVNLIQEGLSYMRRSSELFFFVNAIF